MNRAKTRVRADVLRRLANNEGLAAMLSSTYGMYGDWHKLFSSILDINKVTADDVQRVARQYFTPANRTTVWLAETSKPAGAAKQTGGRR